MRNFLLLAGLCLGALLTAQTNEITNGEFDDGLTGWRTITNGDGQIEVTVTVGPGSATPVAIGGGGYVTGVHYHPTSCGLLYMRTDVGGAFRYDYGAGEWTPLFNNFSLEQENYYGVNALALAPSDDNVVYVAADKAEYFDGPSDVLVSRDRGRTWAPTGLNKRFFGFGNFFSKVYGPALAVDPDDADRLYAGTINEGLWYKDGRETTWQKVGGIPNGTDNIGVKSIVYGPDRTLYVGVTGVGIFRGTNGNQGFTLIPGTPTNPLEVDVDGAGRVFVATETGLYVYGTDGQWTQTRTTDAFSSVSVHPDGSGQVVALQTTFGNGSGDLLYSTDNGSNWRVVDYRRESFPGWYPSFFWSNAGASIAFDPCQEAAVTYSDFFAVWQTNFIAADTSSWSTYSRGHEETYVTDLMSPPTGKRLYAALADDLGFFWEDDVSALPERTILGSFEFTVQPFLNNGSSLDYSGCRPEAKVLAANVNNFGGQGYIVRSDNEFSDFTVRIAPGSLGRVAMAADDPENMVIYTTGDTTSRVYYTTDGGESWSLSGGAPSGISDGFFRSRNPLSADRFRPATFYLYEQPGRVLRSEDGGATFTLAGSDLPTNVPFDNYELIARPDVGGELWVSLDGAGLFRSVDGGVSFDRIDTFERSVTFGFGTGASVGDSTAVYVYGVAGGEEGLFHSTDSGVNWSKVDMGITWPNGPRALTADLRDYGRVYIGSDGSGILSVTLGDSATSIVPTRAVRLGLTEVNVSPNPAGEAIRLAFTSERAFRGRLTWSTLSGRRLQAQDIVVAAGENAVPISLADFPRGVLIGILEGPAGSMELRVVRH